MAFYYVSQVDPKYEIYVGKDKFENEKLIRYGLPCDVWFHVDNYSSAHVYVRLPVGVTFATMPRDIIIECAEITKTQSIEGSKVDKVQVVYTPWANLKKTGGMDVGQVGFHKEREVRKIGIEGRCREAEKAYLRHRTEEERDLPKIQREYAKQANAHAQAGKDEAAKAAAQERALARAAERRQREQLRVLNAVDPRQRDRTYDIEEVRRREAAEAAAMDMSSIDSSEADLLEDGPALF